MALRNIAKLVLGAALLAAPAMAQTPPSAPAAPIQGPGDLSEEQMMELYCVYDLMAADKDVSAIEGSIVRGDKAQTVVAKKIFEKAKGDCTTRHTWTKTQAEVAGIVGTSGVLTDLMEHELRAKGFDDKRFKAVLGVSDKLSAEDFEKMLAMGQGKADDAFLARVKKLLVLAGVPEDRNTVEFALSFLQGSMAEYDAALRWVDGKLY